jgi:hypothetical protein
MGFSSGNFITGSYFKGLRRWRLYAAPDKEKARVGIRGLCEH